MIDEIAFQWLASVLDVSVQFTVLAGLVAVVLLLLRRLTPSIRHLVWLLVLLRLATPVGLTSLLGTVPASLAEPPTAGGAGSSAGVAGGRSAASTLATTTGSAGRAALDAGDGDSRTSSDFAASPVVAVFLAWGAGVLILATVQALRAARRRVRTRAVTALPPDIQRRVGRLRRELGLRRDVETRVVADDAVAGPAVEGWLRTRILLPASLVRRWNTEELDPILLHELVHVARLYR